MASLQPTISMSSEQLDYQKKMINPFYFRMAMLAKLPSVIFWGIGVKTLNHEKCEVTLPFTWKTQNPFKSIYFAALAGAAELSTGLLCQLAIAGKGKFSMLVVDFRAEFHKKASTKTTFSCENGEELFALINQMKAEDTSQFTTISLGKNTTGEVVAKFYVTWSFKKKA